MLSREKGLLFGGQKGNVFLIFCIVIALLGSFYAAIQREKVESASKTTTVLLEWTQLNDLSAKEGTSVADVLTKLGSSMNGVLFKEPNLTDFDNQHLASVLGGDELIRQIKRGDWLWGQSRVQEIDPAWNIILCQNEIILNQVNEQLSVKTKASCRVLPLKYLDGSDAYMLATTYPLTDLMVLGMGFVQSDLQQVADAGLDIVVQIRTFPNVNEESVDAVFNTFLGFPVIAVGFNDDNLPGSGLPSAQWGKACGLLAEKLQNEGLPLMTAEFFSQKGLNALAAKVDYNILRMHSIQEKERAAMTVSQVAQRFQLAASERNMRLLLVRFGLDMGLDNNMAYLNEINTALEAKGLNLGTAQPMSPIELSSLILILIALGVAAGGIFLCRYLSFGKYSWLLGALGFALAALFILTGRLGRASTILSFAAVVIFPTLSICLNVKNEPVEKISKSVGTLLITTACSLIGAILMVGAMADRGYMVAVNIFTGVKLAHVLPLLLLLFIFWSRQKNQGNMAQLIRRTWHIPVKVGYMAVLVLLAAALGIYVLRTGNDAVTVSSLERTFRVFLDQLLVVRPRTKEFLLGHPIFLLLVYYGYKKAGMPALLIGAIGQISLVNTFAHAHTPLWVSLLRTGNGLILGIVIGIVLILIVNAGKRLWQKKIAVGGALHE